MQCCKRPELSQRALKRNAVCVQAAHLEFSALAEEAPANPQGYIYVTCNSVAKDAIYATLVSVLKMRLTMSHVVGNEECVKRYIRV